ncbi:MAG TPA: DUF1800 domain-containing protein [Blastocatellia bacterium]|nr:DUF1800 domain-containing protein [Blastocatellia bacterium]
MRSIFRVTLTIFLTVVFITPSISGATQQTSPPVSPQAFEPLVNRIREGLKLNETQVGDLRKILIKHSPKLMELRNRAQTNPYAPGLQPEVDKEQKAIREELSALLDDDQKTKLAEIDLRPLVPTGPPFVVVNILPRMRLEPGSVKLAGTERSIPAPVIAAKGRSTRLTDDQRILHLLNRLTFGPTPGAIAHVREIGVDRFINEQLQPETIDDSDLAKRLEVLATQRLASAELYQFYPPFQVAEQRANDKNAPPVFGRPQQITGELVQQKIVRAVSSNRQLQEVLTDFWFNHFNVFAQKEAEQWLVTSYERDVIRPRVLGKFRDLLLATAESPAMLFYLDNWLSASPDSKQPRPAVPRPQNVQPSRPAPGANQKPPDGVMTAPGEKSVEGTKIDGSVTDPNARMTGSKQTEQNQQSAAKNPQAPPPNPQQARPPARKPGINENYARELMELHTLGVDGGYTQKDVQEVARCFTGWTVDRPFQGGGFVFRPWMHDDGSKVVLGVTIPAGGGVNDGLRVIEILAKHPSTARFISKKLCQRFISDEPPAQLVERVAQVFLKTDGDIREVLRAIISSAEFNSPAAFRAKIKSPLELMASAIRAIDGDTNGAPALHEWIRRMGEPLYQYAFPTGYGEDSAKWVNTGVFFNRINFAVAFANNQINGTTYDPSRLVATDVTGNPDALTSQLSALIVHTELSAESLRAVRAGLVEQSTPLNAANARPAVNTGSRPEAVPARATPVDMNPERRKIAQVVGLLLGSAEFQRR